MEMQQATKIILAWELYEQEIGKGYIAKQLNVNRETVRIWIRSIEEHPEGILGFLEQYRTAKKEQEKRRRTASDIIPI